MKVYIVQNQEGKYFRAIGYAGFGKSWVDEIEKARLYTKIGPARSRVTFFSKNYPNYGVPKLIEFNLDIEKATVIDMTEYANKKITKIIKDKLKHELNNLKWDLEHKLKDRERLEKEIAQIENKLK